LSAIIVNASIVRVDRVFERDRYIMPAIVVFALPGCLVIAHASIEETQLKFARRTKPVVLSLRFSPCAGTWSKGVALDETTRPIA
jgi:hypothetical protein